MGRYLRIAAEMGPELAAGIDLSLAVEAARELTADLRGRRDRAGATCSGLPSRGVVRSYLLDRSARSHPRSAHGLPPAGRAAEARGTDRRLGLPPGAARRRADHECPPGRLDTAAPGAAMVWSRWMAPIGGWKRKLMASPRLVRQRLGVALCTS